MTAVLWAALPLLTVLGQQPPVRPVAATSVAPVQTEEDLYRHAIDLYRARNYTAAFDAMNRLSQSQIDAVLSRIERLRRHGARKTAASEFDWSRRDVLAAGLLHGDIALALAGTSDLERFDDNLRVAVRVLRDADTPEAGSREKPETFTRDWLRAAASVLLVHALGISASAVLDYGRELFPDDGQLLLTRGMLAEFDSMASVSSTSYSQFGLEMARDSRQKALTRAADAYARALQAMPDSDYARARLAHVDIALKRDDAAIPLLERARNSPYPTPAYLAALMLGDIRARQGDGSDAEALYRFAIASSHGAQSGYVALSMLQYGLGRKAEAAATLDTMYAQHQAAPVDDPWWSYVVGLPQQPIAVLDALRAEARQ